MKLRFTVAIVLVVIISGCTLRPRITTISVMNDIDKYIVNGPHTIDWTYCGKTENLYVILKRNDGEFRSPNDPLFHKLPMKWGDSSWFVIRPDGISIPNDIDTGDKLILEPEGFVKKISSNFMIDPPKQHGTEAPAEIGEGFKRLREKSGIKAIFNETNSSTVKTVVITRNTTNYIDELTLL